jgi:hypothetical protein
MRITIDEEAKLVHLVKGSATVTLALPRSLTRRELEAAADGIRAAFERARIVVVNGSPIRL